MFNTTFNTMFNTTFNATFNTLYDHFFLLSYYTLATYENNYSVPSSRATAFIWPYLSPYHQNIIQYDYLVDHVNTVFYLPQVLKVAEVYYNCVLPFIF